MKNYIASGKMLTIAAAAALVSGQGVLTGGLLGVAVTDAASGDEVALQTEGVFEMDKLTTDVMAVGDLLYWDDGNSRWTKTTTGNYQVGTCVEAAGNGATKVKVKLSGVAVAASA